MLYLLSTFSIMRILGSLAQLGERYPYKVDVIGSSPITSTILEKCLRG